MNNTDKLLNTSVESFDKLFEEVQDLAYKLQWAKTQSYGNSCYRRSLTGVAHNIFRKIDRLDNINAQNPMCWENPESVGGETILDTVADSGVYMFKMMAAYAVTHPELFAKWKKFVLDLYEETKKSAEAK